MPRIGDALKAAVLAILPSGSCTKTGTSISFAVGRVYQGSLTPLSTSKTVAPRIETDAADRLDGAKVLPPGFLLREVGRL